MTDAYTGEGIAKGATAILDYHRGRPERELRREEAELRQRAAEARFAEWQQNAPNRQTQQEAELATLKNQLQQQNAKLLKTATFDAFRMYNADGDTRHLNRFLQEAKENPAGARIYGDFARVDALTQSPEVDRMLAQAGFANPAEIYADKDLAKDLVIATDIQGNRQIVDMNDIYAGTGYTQYMTDLELRELTTRANIKKALRGPESAATSMIQQIAKEQQISTLEAAKEYYKAQRLGKATIGGTSGKERMIERIMQENPDLSYEEAQLRVDPTAKQKDLARVEAVRAELDEIAGGDYFTADVNDPTVRRRIGPKITELERLSGKELSNEEKRFMRDARTLINLGGTAGEELTAAETGIIDKFLRDVRKYISDNVEGTAGTSSYESFRNVFRNALYGASLTQAEIDAFQRAAGSLQEQLGPVLAKLRTQMQTIKDSLQGVYDMQDEAVAYYYVGSTLDDVDAKLEALDERISLLDTAGGDSVIRAEETPTPGAKRSLEDIWNEG